MLKGASQMRQKAIFITGASAGIGKATALKFAQHGWFVGLYDIDAAGLKALAEEIGKDCCYQVMDVADASSTQAAIDHFAKHANQQMHVLFNNAGVLDVGEFDEITLEAHKRIFEINVFGLIHCIHQALPLLKRSSPAQVINMSSASALYGHPLLTAYASSKMAVRSLTEGLEIALEKHGIRVCDIMPMYVKTGMVDNTISRWPGLKRKDIHLSPDDVANAVWHAATGKHQLHHLVGLDTKAFGVLGKIVPAKLTRLLVKKTINYR